MSIVTGGTTKSGAKFRIHDDAYIHNTPQRNEALRLDACRIAHRILLQCANENQGGNKHAEGSRTDGSGQR